MKVKVGFKLWGSIDVDVKWPVQGKDLASVAQEKLLELPARELLNGVEGMPDDVEGDAIEMISVEMEVQDGEIQSSAGSGSNKGR